MKNSVFVLCFSLLSLCGFTGCGFFSASMSEAFGDAKKNRKTACYAVENISMAKLQNKDYYIKRNGEKITLQEAQNIFSMIASVNYYTGEVNFTTMDDNMLISKLHCPVFKPTKTLQTETKSFAVNGSGNDDFTVKVTKKVINVQKIQKDKVLENDIKATSFEVENMAVVNYNDRLYPAHSSFIKNVKKKLENEYLKRKNALQLPCFKLAGQTYCDGDLINIGSMLLMVRVNEVGGGSVRWQLYYYKDDRGAYYLADNHFQMQMQMKAQQVVGNDYLKNIEREMESFALKLKDIKTFKEWQGGKMQINKPSKAEMQRIFALWHNEPKFKNYEYEDSTLAWLFKTYPHNTDLHHIIIKATCLDTFYGTNITMNYKIHQVAQHIAGLDFDKRVKSGDIRLVDDIASIESSKPKILSFASKYCVWHNHNIYGRDDFVIYDSIVKAKLKEFNKTYPFATFDNKDLENYATYKEILDSFRKTFGLKCKFRELDWYLWRLGKLEGLENAQKML